MRKFFIVGCPRSGTTMLQQALNRHSQIVIPPETKYFFSFFGHTRRRQARHVERLNRDLRINLPAPTRAVRSVAEGRAFYELMARQYVARLPEKDPVYFGEKTPEHTGFLPRIRQVFPAAKILVLCRDGRDVASSLTRVPWMSPNLHVNFLVWLYYCRIVRTAQANPGPDIHFVRYEDIVAAPERELEAALRFLGLPYEPAVAEGWGNREGVPEREDAWKARALLPITTDRVGVFRRELSHDQIGILERLGREALPSLGYRLLTDGRRPLSAAFLLRLGCDFARLVFRLPWHSVLKEMVCRSLPAAPAAVPAPAALVPALPEASCPAFEFSPCAPFSCC
jgi:hypothetical protein